MKQILQALKSRTIRLSLLIAVLSILQGFIGFIPASPVVQALIGMVIACSIVIARAVTTTSLITKT